MSSVTIKKVRTEHFVLMELSKFMTYGTFSGARKGLKYTPKSCFNCRHKFQDNEFIYLGIIQGKKNEIFCEKCADKFHQQGVEVYDLHARLKPKER